MATPGPHGPLLESLAFLETYVSGLVVAVDGDLDAAKRGHEGLGRITVLSRVLLLLRSTEACLFVARDMTQHDTTDSN